MNEISTISKNFYTANTQLNNSYKQKEELLVENIDERAAKIANQAWQEIQGKAEKGSTTNLLKQLSPTKKREPINEKESILAALPNNVEKLTELSDKISFYRGYENEKFFYPTNEEMQPLVELTRTIEKEFKKFKSDKNFVNQFNFQFSPFLDAFGKQIKEAALTSRKQQLAKMKKDENIDEAEKEYQLPVIQAHIEALETKKDQCWKELSAILNLSGFHKDRKATMKEQEFYRFITLRYDALHAPKTAMIVAPPTN